MASPENRFQASVRRVLPWLVAALGAVSGLVGARAAMAVGRSQDFQWSGTRMLLDRVDPWMEFLRGDPLHRILLLQIPNYLPALYVMLAPFGLLPFSVAKAVWVVCNLCFAVGSVVLACRFYGLRGRMVLVALGLFLMATSLRNSLGSGQQGLLVLLLWCVALLSPVLTDARSVVAGVSYFKFSFAPPLLLYLLIKGRLRAVLWSLVLPLLSTVLVWLWLPGGHDAGALLRCAAEPFQVAGRGFLLRGADANLADVLDPPLRAAGLSLPQADLWELLIGTGLCVAALYFGIARSPRSSTQYSTALLALVSFALFRHHNYDQVVLLLPVCFGLAHWSRPEAKALLGLLACPLYLQEVAERLHLNSRHLYLPEFFLLVGAGAMLYRLRHYSVPVPARGFSRG